MTGAEIIALFNLFVDDTTELSAAQELALLNRVYKRICSNRPYEFLKTNATGAVAAGGTIALPADFLHLTENSQETDISVGQGQSVSKVVYVDDEPYNIINFSDRENSSGAYIDFAASTITFTDTTVTGTYKFDYIKIPADLTVATSPIFPTPYHEAIGYGMAIDGFMTQLFDKAKSYARENEKKFDEIMANMDIYNANLRAE